MGLYFLDVYTSKNAPLQSHHIVLYYIQFLREHKTHTERGYTMKMFFDATAARATTNARLIEEATRIREYAEKIIVTLVSPGIEQAASDGCDRVIIALDDEAMELAQLEIMRILAENNFNVSLRGNHLVINW